MYRCPDFQIEHLSKEQQRIARLILRITRAKTGGGCRAFYTLQEWRDRSGEYGLKSRLIVLHDGGDLAPWFNLAYERPKQYQRLVDKLAEESYFVEACTSWYSAIYMLDAR